MCVRARALAKSAAYYDLFVFSPWADAKQWSLTQRKRETQTHTHTHTDRQANKQKTPPPQTNPRSYKAAAAAFDRGDDSKQHKK